MLSQQIKFWGEWKVYYSELEYGIFDPWVGKIPCRRERLPTPVFWPGEFHGQYSPWGHKELDVTEQLLHTSSAYILKKLIVGC